MTDYEMLDRKELTLLRIAQAFIKFISELHPDMMRESPEFFAHIRTLCELNDQKYVAFMRGHNNSPGEETDPMVTENFK